MCLLEPQDLRLKSRNAQAGLALLSGESVCVWMYPLDGKWGALVTTMVYAPRPTRGLLPLLVLTKETLASAGQWMPWAVPFPEPLVCAKHKCACFSPGSGPLRSQEGARRPLKCACCLQPQGNLTRMWWSPIGQSGTQRGCATCLRSCSCIAVGWDSSHSPFGLSVELVPGPQAACSGRAVNDARWPSASFESSREQSASKHGRSASKASRRGGRLPSLCMERGELRAPDPGAGPRLQLAAVWERPSPYKDRTRLLRVDPTCLSQKCRK